MKTILWLDDIRDPHEGDWGIFSPINISETQFVWVKNYEQFTKWITEKGLPEGICFDHDLGEDDLGNELKSGMDCVNWLVDYCMDNKLILPKWNIQSANPVGKNNMNSKLNNFRKWQNQNQ